MYDTVRFWFKRGEVCPRYVLSLLPDVRKHYDRNNRVFYYGTFRNFVVTVSDFGVFLHGSLAKYYLGNNIDTLKFHEVEIAIENLSQEFGADLSTASVTRIDFSTVIFTNQPPIRYYKFLGKSGRYRRRLDSSGLTLYYNLKRRRLVFYDKTAEAQTKGVDIPTQFVGQNLFRYEMRFLGRLKQQLRLSYDVMGATLYDHDFYRRLVQRWHNEFMKISKINIMTTNRIKTPKQAFEAYCAKLVRANGQKALDNYISKLNFSDPKYRSRAKAIFNKLLTNPAGKKADLVSELEVKIAEKAEQALADTQ